MSNPNPITPMPTEMTDNLVKKIRSHRWTSDYKEGLEELTRLKQTIESQQQQIEELRRDKERVDDSPTWPYVLAFAKRMEAKLAKNRHKGDRDGWINDNPFALYFRVQDEWNELGSALNAVHGKEHITEAEQQAVINEAADVANFAMMVADIYSSVPALDATKSEGSERETNKQ